MDKETDKRIHELLAEKAGFYAVIPGAVRYDPDLSYFAKILYGEISALATKEGYCYATNSYFERLYSMTKTNISQTIGKLVKKEYLILKLIYKEGTKEIIERRLYLNDKFFKIKMVSSEDPTL